MYQPTLVKILGGGAGLACTMVLVMTSKIDGNTAMGAVTAITSVFIGSTAILGGAKAVAMAMSASQKKVP
jgi:hypothetical protein